MAHKQNPLINRGDRSVEVGGKSDFPHLKIKTTRYVDNTYEIRPRKLPNLYKKEKSPSAKHLAGKFGNRFYKRQHLK